MRADVALLLLAVSSALAACASSPAGQTPQTTPSTSGAHRYDPGRILLETNLTVPPGAGHVNQSYPVQGDWHLLSADVEPRLTQPCSTVSGNDGGDVDVRFRIPERLAKHVTIKAGEYCEAATGPPPRSSVVLDAVNGEYQVQVSGQAVGMAFHIVVRS